MSERNENPNNKRTSSNNDSPMTVEQLQDTYGTIILHNKLDSLKLILCLYK